MTQPTIKQLALKLAAGNASKAEQDRFEALLQKPENEELRTRFSDMLMALEVLNNVKLPDEGNAPFPKGSELAVVDTSHTDTTPLNLRELLANKDYNAAYQRAWAALDSETERLIEAIALPGSELAKVIRITQDSRMQACREFSKAKLKLINTLAEVQSAFAQKDEVQKRLDSQRNEIKANSEAVDYLEQVVVKSIQHVCVRDWQGDYVAADLSKNGVLVANRKSSGVWESFFLAQLGDGRSLFLSCNKRFVCADLNRNALLVADRHIPREWELFQILPAADGHVNIRATNGKFLSSRADEGKHIRACATEAKLWERFQIEFPLICACCGLERGIGKFRHDDGKPDLLWKCSKCGKTICRGCIEKLKDVGPEKLCDCGELITGRQRRDPNRTVSW